MDIAFFYVHVGTSSNALALKIYLWMARDIRGKIPLPLLDISHSNAANVIFAIMRNDKSTSFALVVPALGFL